jgi:hypothetical protein
MKFIIAFTFLFATSAQAASSLYCTVTNGGGEDQMLHITKHQVTVSAVEGATNTANGLQFTAKYDPTYSPRGNADRVRFVGEQDGNNREAILDTAMLDGAEGHMQIRGSEDSYWSRDYNCKSPQN